jgi:hypothetical protein
MTDLKCDVTVCKDGTVHKDTCRAVAGRPGCDCVTTSRQHLPVVDKLNTRRTQFDRTDNVEYAEAIDAVAEYIAANDEYDAANQEMADMAENYGEEHAFTRIAIKRVAIAILRRAAAHTRMKGETK